MNSSFADRVRVGMTNPVMEDGESEAKEIITDLICPADIETDKFDVDNTDKLMVIPISQEIAADFRLIDYENTIRRMEDVLVQRGMQRNPMLIGDPGIGKTAIIQGMVQRKNNNDLSTHMYKRTFFRLNTSRLLHLDLSDISREFDQVLEEFSLYDVMVIENFYTMITYLKQKGSNSVLIAFLEALSRRKLQAIITCNKRERSLIITEVPEIHEFFARVEVPEPSDEQLLNILRGVRRSYEARYGIVIPDTTLCTFRDLTQKYPNAMEGWVQPGRALIVQDRTIAQFSVRMNSRSKELSEMEAELSTARDELDSLTEIQTTQDDDRCQELRIRIAELEPKAKILREQWTETTAPIQALLTEKMALDKRLHNHIMERERLEALRTNNAALIAQNTSASEVASSLTRINAMIKIARSGVDDLDKRLSKVNLSEIRDHVITPEHATATFAELSGIDMSALNADERERILHMEDILGGRVYGQPEAIKAIANAVRRARAGLTDNESCPKCSFLLLGPSGVGKTELCKALAQFLTADEKNMVRFDMSEYMESHSVSKFIGAPPGYAGYDDGGLLTNAVKKRLKAVVAFDEAEKAHQDIFKIMLQVLTDGRLTSGQGETVDFKETYCMFTSNLGAKYFVDPALTFEEAAVKAHEAVTQFFAPEFIGRLDAILCFHRLDMPMLIRVAQKRITSINAGLSKRRRKFTWPDTDIARFCEKVQDSRYGARPILTNMKALIEGPLAVSILEHEDVAGEFVAGFNETVSMAFHPFESPHG